MAYPAEFIKAKRVGYVSGRMVVSLAHLAVTFCVLSFVYLSASGSSNASISGVPLGLSLLLYAWGYGLIQKSHENWLVETGQVKPGERKPERRFGITLNELIILIFLFFAIPTLIYFFVHFKYG